MILHQSSSQTCNHPVAGKKKQKSPTQQTQLGWFPPPRIWSYQTGWSSWSSCSTTSLNEMEWNRKQEAEIGENKDFFWQKITFGTLPEQTHSFGPKIFFDTLLEKRNSFFERKTALNQKMFSKCVQFNVFKFLSYQMLSEFPSNAGVKDLRISIGPSLRTLYSYFFR